MLTPLGIHSLNVLSTLGRSLRRFRTTGGDLFAASAIGDTIRRNEIGIQMIDESMRSILFPASLPSSKSSWSPDAPEISCLIKTHLQRHDLWEKPTTVSQSVDLQLEPLLGNSIFDHFTAICERNYCDYFNLANLLLSSPPPQLPTTWRLCQGWTRYVHGSDPVSVQHPLEDVYVFDVETLMSQSRCAVMAIAMSPTAVYCWLSPNLFEEKLPHDKEIKQQPSNGLSQDHSHSLHSNPPIDRPFFLSESPITSLENGCTHAESHFIPFGFNQNDRPGLIVGHHIGFDRARIMDEYDLKQTKLRFLDTMSLHIACAGLNSYQRMEWKKIDKLMRTHLSTNHAQSSRIETAALGHHDTLDDFLHSADFKWYRDHSLNSLRSVAKLYLGKEIDKSARDVFINGTLEDVKANLSSLIDYCAQDVLVTFNVFKKLYTQFSDRKMGHLASFAGILEMGSSYLPVSQRWKQYLEICDEQFEQHQNHIFTSLSQIAKVYLAAEINISDPDCFLEQLDWRPIKTRKMGVLPQWWRSHIKAGQFSPSFTIRSRLAPILLRMTWNNYPLVYLGNKAGWCFRAPLAELSAVSVKARRVDRDFLADALSKEKNSASSGSNEKYFDLLARYEHAYLFFKLPTSDGGDSCCTNVFTKYYLPFFVDGSLKSDHPIAKIAIHSNVACSYWISSRQRIRDQFVVWRLREGQSHDNLVENSKNLGHTIDGVILPPVITMGTVTRRAVESTWLTASNAKPNRVGSELKSNIVAPAGYKIVGADVDSQELWIASLLGDAQFGVHGASAFGWMTLQGSKSAGTDLHSRSASILQSSRDHAKMFNYARIYGSGVKFTSSMLLQTDPNLTVFDATDRAKALYASTKGKMVHRYGADIGQSMYSLIVSYQIKRQQEVVLGQGQ